jgi:hypothetical protein
MHLHQSRIHHPSHQFHYTVYPEIFAVTFILRDKSFAKIRLSKFLLLQIFCTALYLFRWTHVLQVVVEKNEIKFDG